MSRHRHPFSVEEVRAAQRGALRLVLLINVAFVAAAFAGGILFRSLALLADAAHTLSDVAAVAIALGAQRLAARPASVRHTYGLQRAEVLGALVNGLILGAVAIWIFVEAARRLGEPPEVVGGGLLAVAAVGLAVNLASVALLFRARGESLNIRAAYVHMAADAAGSVGAMLAGAAVLLWDAHWADPAISIAIGLLVLWATWGLLRDTVHVLLEGAPQGMDARHVERAIADHPRIGSVHHLHLWNLASDVPALSAHVVIEQDMSLHDAQELGDEVKMMLAERFGIEHATLDLECHPCDPVDVEH
jgi:cobalt-zinc-cadmium efflux system protein